MELRQEAGQDGSCAGMDAGASSAGGPYPPGAGRRSRGSGRASGERERVHGAVAQRRRSEGATERRTPGSDQGEAIQGRDYHTPPAGGRGENPIFRSWPACRWLLMSWRTCQGRARGPGKTGGPGVEVLAEPGGARGWRAAWRPMSLTGNTRDRGCCGADRRQAAGGGAQRSGASRLARGRPMTLGLRDIPPSGRRRSAATQPSARAAPPVRGAGRGDQSKAVQAGFPLTGPGQARHRVTW